MKTINNALIRTLKPCYDPSEKNIPDDETLSVIEWVNKYRSIVPDEDIIWLLCHNEFLPDRDLRLFAVWCAREALKLDSNPDKRSINACNVAERFANGEATIEELAAARADATSWAASWAALRDAADAASDAAAAARDASWDAADASADASADAWDAARDAQMDKLLTYFK